MAVSYSQCARQVAPKSEKMSAKRVVAGGRRLKIRQPAIVGKNTQGELSSDW
jgi:hypothetical protein